MNTESANARIVYLDRAGLPERIQIPPPVHAHTWVNYPITNQQQVIERARDADILVVNKVPVTRQTLEVCNSIRHIAVTATGYNVVDISACQDLDVSVSNIPCYAATTVAEHVITCALTLRRELTRYRQQVINNAWQKSDVFCLFDRPVNDLRGATLGIIGLGEIGLATATLGAALGMNVVYTSRTAKTNSVATQVNLKDLLGRSDIISVHCSLTTETENLIDNQAIDAMQDHAILINTARGGIVNEEAAVKAIQQNKIGGLAFDVLATEPPQGNSPLLRISTQDNVIITPHIAWASEQAMQSLATILSKNIDAFLSGKPQNIVS